MPTIDKPIFRPDALRPHLKAFTPTPAALAARSKMTAWANKLASGKLDKAKETELLPDYLSDVFGGVLGYVGRPADPYTLRREALVKVDGKFADAGLGRFTEDAAAFVAVLEGKGPRDPLDRPFAGRTKSAVEQSLTYAVQLKIDWYLVTNLKEIRLLHKGHDTHTFERFDLASVAADDAEFRRFVYLLGADRLVAPGGPHLNALLTDSATIGQNLTDQFYKDYRDLRLMLLESLRQHNAKEDATRLLAATQKILDRILFVAFCEDRQLLPGDSIKKAFEHRNPYLKLPVWQNFVGLFHSIDLGNDELNIAKYNGGLFKDDPFLNDLHVPDAICERFKNLADYEFGSVGAEVATDAKLIDVEILGHIFEQSISDLEEMRRGLTEEAPDAPTRTTPTKRKKEGAFYTPAFVTRYIVAETLGPVLRDRFEKLRSEHESAAKGTAAKVLVDPRAFDPADLNEPQRFALARFWGAWLDELETIRVVDPSCGSGAFLIEAFDQLFNEYAKAQGYRTELGEGNTLFDVEKKILTQNLFGMDLNGEAVEIARLSCWIKTAEKGKELTALDHNIQTGNSVVAEPGPLAKWRERFPAAFADGGFDVVIGNPPYVRQEWISSDKPFLKQHYKAFDGVADLYVYFYELGLNILKPGGRLGLISSNSFIRAGYAEALRKLLTSAVRLEQVIDLGDTQVFSDAKDVYPVIVIAAKDTPTPDTQVEAFRFRRNDPTENIRSLIAEGATRIPVRDLSHDGWQFDDPEVSALRRKLMERGQPLDSLLKGQIYRGLITGLNEAFVVTTERKNEMIADGRSHGILKPFIGGQHVQRWQAEDSGNWVILLPSGITSERCGSTDPTIARQWLKNTYPAVESHLSSFEEAAKKRTDKGQFWWELRACDYYSLFEGPKIIYPDIAKFSRFAFDKGGIYSNNTTYFLPTNDLFILGALNSKAIWFALSGISIPFGERAGEFRYRLFTQYIEKLPIPTPTDEARAEVETLVAKLIDMKANESANIRAVLEWLRTQFGIDKPTQKLAAIVELSADDFIAEVRKIRGRKAPLSVADVKQLKAEHTTSVEPLKANAREALGLERRVSDLVNAAYGLTPADVALMWQTAPPRMPIPAPHTETKGADVRRLTLKEVNEQHGGTLPPDAVFRSEEDAEPVPSTKPKRRNRSERFAALNAFVDFGIADADLTPAEALVWFVLFRDTKGTGTARTGQTDIARRAGLSVRGVKLALRNLKAKGMVQVVRRGQLNLGPSTYRVHPTRHMG